MQLKKKLFLILACVVSICCLMAAKSSDNSEIEQVLNDFFETKEMNFASSEDISLNNFFTTYTRETLTTKTFYKLFLFEKQVRLENDPDILNETFDVEINDIAVDNNSAKVTAYEYYVHLVHLLFHILHHYFIDFLGGDSMQNSTLILTEQRPSHDKSTTGAIIQQAITTWLTKELSK